MFCKTYERALEYTKYINPKLIKPHKMFHIISTTSSTNNGFPPKAKTNSITSKATFMISHIKNPFGRIKYYPSKKMHKTPVIDYYKKISV